MSGIQTLGDMVVDAATVEEWATMARSGEVVILRSLDAVCLLAGYLMACDQPLREYAVQLHRSRLYRLWHWPSR